MEAPSFLYPSPATWDMFDLNLPVILRESRRLGLISYIETIMAQYVNFALQPMKMTYAQFDLMRKKKATVITILKKRDYSPIEVDLMFRRAISTFNTDLVNSRLSNANKWHMYDIAMIQISEMQTAIGMIYIA